VRLLRRRPPPPPPSTTLAQGAGIYNAVLRSDLWAEPLSDSLTANPGQRLTVPDSLTALTALSPTV